MKKVDAIKLFLDREGKELRGKHNLNIIVLWAIFLVAICTIGFGSASIKYLQYKMDDPFINWIDIVVKQKVADKSKVDLNQFLDDKNNQSTLDFNTPEPNWLLNMDFCHQIKDKNIQLQGRSISSKSSILKKILDNSNVFDDKVRKSIGFSSNELGLIITQSALVDLGYTEIPPFVELALSYDTATCNAIGLESANVNGNYPVAFPIVAVVKQLPGMNSFLFTNRFLKDYSSINKTPWDITEYENNREVIFVGQQEEVMSAAKEAQKEGFETSVKPYKQSWNEELYCVSLCKTLNEDELLVEYNKISNQLCYKYSGLRRIYEFQVIQQYSLDDPAYYSVQIKKLENILSFRDVLYDKCGIKLEMSNVEQKNNFQFVQRMGNILSICIILIAVLFICFFIYFMLSTHFQRIQRNLGTFKAFGIDNMTLYLIYICLLLLITVVTFFGALLVAWFICNFVLDLFTHIEQDFMWVDVLVWQNALLLVLAIVAAVMASYLVARNMLKNTPGDLIYNRNKK